MHDAFFEDLEAVLDTRFRLARVAHQQRRDYRNEAALSAVFAADLAAASPLLQ